MSVHQINIAIMQSIYESCKDLNKNQCIELYQKLLIEIELKLEAFEDEDE